MCLLPGTTGPILLNRRTLDGAIAAKDTAVTLLWFQDRSAVCTGIKPPAGVRWHFFDFLEAAGRAGEGGKQS